MIFQAPFRRNLSYLVPRRRDVLLGTNQPVAQGSRARLTGPLEGDRDVALVPLDANRGSIIEKGRRDRGSPPAGASVIRRLRSASSWA